MSREKQIEEMAHVIAKADDTCRAQAIAKALYNKNYRKQREGEWIVDGDYLKTMHCSACNYTANTIYDKTPYCPNCGAKMKVATNNNVGHKGGAE